MDFKQTQQAYVRLKDQLEQGRVTAKEFEARVNEMVVTDSAGTLWQIGVKTGKWYHFDKMKWMEDIPPGLPPLSPAAPPERISNSGAQVSKRPVKAPERIFRRQAPERISQPSNQSNYHPPTQQLRKRTRKVPWVIGSVVSACACVAVVSVVLFTVLSHRPKILGQMTVTPSGGSFQQQAVTITASPGTVSIPLTLAITQHSDNSKPDEGVLAQTAPIQISGALDQLHGSLLMTLPIPSDWLTADGTLPAGETVVIVEQGQAFGTSVGVILDRHPLPTQIDLQARTATVEVIFAPSDIASRTSPHLASPLRRDDYALTYRMLKIKKEQFECYNQDFKVWAGFVPISEENCRTLLDLLVDAKKKLEDLGFTDALSQHNRPIQIYLKSTDSAHGYAQVGKFSSVNNSYIVLDNKELKKGQDMDLSDPDKTQFIKSIIGHEMFHLVQYFYNPILIKAWVPGMLTEQENLKTLWSDEAMSVWFEPIAVNNQSYLPGLEGAFLGSRVVPGFLTEPLAVPVIGEDDQGNKSLSIGERHKGYGSAFFLHFLTNRYGNDLIREVLERQLSVSSAQPIAQVAWDQALRARDSSLSDEYVYFLEGFLIRGEKIHTDQFVNPLNRVENQSASNPIETVYVDVRLDDDKLDDREGAWYAVFIDLEQILIKSSERGYIKAGSSPALTSIQIPLQNIQFKTVRLIVKPSELINTYPSTLGIKISCSGGSLSQACPESVGLLAYPIPKGYEFNLPSYDGALSNADSYIFAGGDNIFLWNSDQFAMGSPYQGLFFIAFNNRLSTSNDPTNVIIDLAYIWKKQLEEPIPPTEEPVPPTEELVLPTQEPMPPTEAPVIPPQPSEMSPEELCEWNNWWTNEVHLPYERQLAQEEYGSDFVSFDFEWLQSFAYNPGTQLCEGGYNHVQCTINQGNPPNCYTVQSGPVRTVDLDTVRARRAEGSDLK